MLRTEGRRAFGWLMLLAALAYFLVRVNGISYMLTEDENEALMVFEFGAMIGFSLPLMPLCAALPFAASFCQDYTSGFSVALSLRAGKGGYLWSKALCTALAGGLALALGALLMALLLNVKFPPDVAAPPMFASAEGLGAFVVNGGFLGYIRYYGARLLLEFLAGSFWALVALCFSAFYPNLPLTLCAPLVLCQLVMELGRYGLIPGYLDVTKLQDALLDLPAASMLLVALGVFFAFDVALAALFRWRAGRRLSYA